MARLGAAGGYRVTLWDDRAYLATLTATDGLVVVDIADPEHPRQVAKIPGQPARMADPIPYGNRTLVATANGGPLIVYDVTSVDDIRELARFDVLSHNVAVHRPGYVIYNARSLAEPPGVVEIYNATNPDQIRLHKEWTLGPTAEDGTPILVPACHEIHVDPERNRAYCAAITQTLVWDVSTPLEPRVLTAITNPAVTAHHTAFPILDHRTLVINDEFAAGFAYGCMGAGSPTGGLWFYDVSASPARPRGYYAAAAPASPRPAEPCFSHTGSELGAGTGWLVWGWVQSGLVLVDASTPASPRLVEQTATGTDTWDARYYRGYVFTADDAGGLGVWRPE